VLWTGRAHKGIEALSLMEEALDEFGASSLKRGPRRATELASS
jgi:hypothetical protein